MKEIILCKYGEITLKGLNKSSFESVLVKNVRRRLKRFGSFDCHHSQSTLYVTPLEDDIDMDEIVEELKQVFGIVKICKAIKLDKSLDAILTQSIDYISEELEDAKTFKVEAKRADKTFPYKSPEICAELGHSILCAYPDLKVDIKNPDLTISVEIREKNAFVNAQKIDGAGGLPVSTSGRGMLLLSGGIDSPVAGYMMAKRGVTVQAIHFEAPPYTSERARLKVEKLAEEISRYCGDIAFHCVPFTDIQVAIKDNCAEEYFTIIMRRIMVEIAQRISEKEDCNCLITGESMGQVASQTMNALVCTDAACRIPVMRPCIGLDKTEIIDIARKIGTFDTSILPYEDCCTVFTPKHPKIKPKLEDVEREQASFDFEPMISQAIEQTSFRLIRCGESTVNL
ncbi:MAG: tRNA 4-thiouridine(8) synthase ThiI [Ruminococcus sp.]|nr:tRNA 4-thiouridine(8) synthase ThiI [Ruminococcus sp.]